MAASKFRCNRCGEEKSNPDDRYGAPVFVKKLKEHRGVCEDCSAKDEPEHPAQSAFNEIVQHANEVGRILDTQHHLDNLWKVRYEPIEWGKLKEKNLGINDRGK